MTMGKYAKHIPDNLYQQILRALPIACVDLIVENSKKEILLLKRKNEPAMGEWWFPGGRIHFMEIRPEAVVRKLREECGMEGRIISEIGTYDVLLGKGGEHPSHGITTVFHVQVGEDDVRMDDQSEAHAWKPCSDWLDLSGTPFVKMILQTFKDTHGNG